jgi:hypothetical protein
MNKNPKVTFIKNGEIYQGYEIGIGMSENKEDYKVIKCDKFDSELKIPNSQVQFGYKNNSETSQEDELLNRPAYSRNAKQWEAVISNGEVISRHDTHTKLKDHYNVGYVKSPDEENELEFDVDYELYYNPDHLK